MKLDPLVQFVGMAHSPALEALVARRVDWLCRFYPMLMSCRVTVEELDKHGQHGRQHAVRIELTLPGAEVGVEHVLRDDAHIALRDAFSIMRRRLHDAVRCSPRTRGRAVEAGKDTIGA